MQLIPISHRDTASNQRRTVLDWLHEQQMSTFAASWPGTAGFFGLADVPGTHSDAAAPQPVCVGPLRHRFNALSASVRLMLSLTVRVVRGRRRGGLGACAQRTGVPLRVRDESGRSGTLPWRDVASSDHVSRRSIHVRVRRLAPFAMHHSDRVGLCAC